MLLTYPMQNLSETQIISSQLLPQASDIISFVSGTKKRLDSDKFKLTF